MPEMSSFSEPPQLDDSENLATLIFHEHSRGQLRWTKACICASDMNPDNPVTDGDGAPSPRRTSKRPRRSRDRARVTRACDQCKRQKIRCTGSHPCGVCMRKRETCTYEASYSRGRAPSPHAVRHVGPEIDRAAAQSYIPPEDSRVGTEPSISTRPSPEPSQTDRQGHYVGPASGISFLFRVQRRVHQMMQSPPTTSIFTFGDAPLPSHDVSLFVIPRKEDTKSLLERYFDFAVPTYRFLHRPTIEAWFEEFYATSGSMAREEEAPAKLAVLFMVFAQASLYIPKASNRASTASDASVRYYLAADHQLGKEKGHVRLASVQARLAQCFYLLSQSRVNHCWSLFGTTSQLVFAIGLHRGKKAGSFAGTRIVDIESRRRVFWCAYTLDKYLSVALGRPRTFREEDIDQELPSCVDDISLLSEGGRSQPSLGQPLMRAVIAHITLSRLLDGILRDLYPIRPLSTRSQLALTSPYTAKLKQWYVEYDDFLDNQRINAALLLPIYQRQRNVLNLAYWHATILAYRPFLLRRLESRQVGQIRRSNASIEKDIDQHISLCINAAMNICKLVTELIDANVMFKAFWFTFYYAFCAVVVIYVIAIREGPASQTYDGHLAAATKCQKQLSAIAEEKSLGSRYCLILEELRKELALQPARPENSQIGDTAVEEARQMQKTVPHPSNPIPPLSDEQRDSMNLIEPVLFDASPNSSLHDLSGWGTFDSMVISGHWDFEELLGEDSFTV